MQKDMINGYQDFYYNVSHMNRAIEFYVNALGLKLTSSNEHWCALSIGNLKLGLHWNGERVVPSTPRNSHGQESGGTLTLVSDNIPEDRKRIAEAGGKILGESLNPWGQILVFEDLDGNVLKLMNSQKTS